MRNINYLMMAFALAGLLIAGCTDAGTKEARKPVGKKDTAADSHDDHGHVHGPMGGEVFEVKDAGINVECVAKYGQNLVMFYVWEDDNKTEKKIRCEKLMGSFSKGEVMTVEIPAIEPEDGMSHRFEIEDEDFAIARKTTGVKMEFEIDGKKYTIDIPKDPHG